MLQEICKGVKDVSPGDISLDPEQGDKQRFELYEYEIDRPSVYLLYSNDLLWQTRGTSIDHLDKQPAS